jgi:hypothetical protein
MAMIENTFFTSASILLRYEEDAIRVADIEKVNSSFCKRKLYWRIVKTCMDPMEAMKHISLYYTNNL